MPATNFTLDDLTSEYAEEDYKPQRPQAKPGIWFEFSIASAVAEQSKQGHLQVKAEAEALDSDGKSMFKKYMNIPMPVSVGSIAAPTYAKGLWLMNVVPLFPENMAYDKIAKDPITGKMIYYKGDKRLEGKDYDAAITEQNKVIGPKALEVAKQWVENGDGHSVDEFVGKKFFAKLVTSKDGKYTNIERPYHVAPDGEDVCYNKKEAMTLK